jgi:hypothetical protein
MKLFNINNNVKVKIFEAGYKHWKAKDDQLFLSNNGAHHCKSIEWYKSKADAQGYVTMQAWELMQIFGDSLIFGAPPTFDTNIILTVTTPR